MLKFIVSLSAAILSLTVPHALQAENSSIQSSLQHLSTENPDAFDALMDKVNNPSLSLSNQQIIILQRYGLVDNQGNLIVNIQNFSSSDDGENDEDDNSGNYSSGNSYYNQQNNSYPSGGGYGWYGGPGGWYGGFHYNSYDGHWDGNHYNSDWHDDHYNHHNYPYHHHNHPYHGYPNHPDYPDHPGNNPYHPSHEGGQHRR